MILTENIRISRIVTGTWKNMFFSGLTCFIAFCINELWLSNFFSFPVFVPTVLGTALAFFIGFNNNQAYDRWWEARKIWGAIVNNSRTWTRQVIYYIHAPDTNLEHEAEKKKEQLAKRHIAFLYALKNNLRDSDHENWTSYLTREEIRKVSEQTNKPNAILSLQTEDLEWLYRRQFIDGFRFIEINKTLTSFCDDMGKSERIKNTIFPTTYNYYSRNFIWIFIYCTTIAMSHSTGIWSIILGSLLGYVFFTIQEIGQILLNPFEAIPTGIPLDQITRTIEINILEMLGEKDIPLPVQSIDGEYIM